MKTQRHHNESGIALILTLTILAVILIMLLAFITSMRTERMAAKAFSDLSKTKVMAEGAVDEAVALMQSSMTNITPTTSYITAPGVVYTWSGGSWVQTLLFISGLALNLNSSNSITGTGPAYPAGTPLQVNWFPVLSSGVNPQLVGRYTYWVDDESTKVNLNTAKSRSLNDPLGYTPAAIDLAQLFTSAGDPLAAPDASAIITYTTGTRPLDTIESLKLGSPSVPSAPNLNPTTFSNSEFFVTANATSPDLTPWGTKRLNLNSLLGPSPTPAQKVAAVPIIAAYLSDPNLKAWYGTGKTFVDKYNNVQQIAANIVDYITPDNIPTDSGGTPPTFLGLKQTPYLNELVISNTFSLTIDPLNPPTGTLTISSTITAELWYMYTNTVPTVGWIAPKNTSIVVAGIPNIALPGVFVGPISLGVGGVVTINQVFPNMLPAGNGTVAGGTYATVVANLPALTFPVSDASGATAYPAILTPGIATATFASPLGRMDYAQISLPTAQGSVSATPLTLVWQAQCNDPRVKPISNTWSPIANLLPNTLGFANTPFVNTATGSGVIQGDGLNDISCHVVSTPTRQRGTMYPSELAYIHTGIPWRTLYLEPQPVAEVGSLPDWLVVDLFSATDITNVAGRMNINVRMDNANSAFPVRTQPLSALLSGNPSAVAVANNIYGFTLDTPPTLPSFATAPNAPNSFTTAGQICEVKGLADGGGLKSAREAPAWDIVNLVTPRSDTFTIWAMAQGIKKVKPPWKNFFPGVDLITGEVKIQAVVQRYEDPSTSPATVRFRTLYYRYIYQ
jgi:type II secretory pathway component PulK